VSPEYQCGSIGQRFDSKFAGQARHRKNCGPKGGRPPTLDPRYATGETAFEAMLAACQQWPDRVWAVEGCEGIGKHTVLRLLDRGEQVVDARVRLRLRRYVVAFSSGSACGVS
jgi:hypothetical protein